MRKNQSKNKLLEEGLCNLQTRICDDILSYLLLS